MNNIDKTLGLYYERGILPNNAQNDVQLSHFTHLDLLRSNNSNTIHDLQSMITFIYLSFIIEDFNNVISKIMIYSFAHGISILSFLFLIILQKRCQIKMKFVVYI